MRIQWIFVGVLVMAYMPYSALAPAQAGGLLGDAIEGLCGGCGAGEALDDAHRDFKENVPVYKDVEEGASGVVRRTTRETLVETAGPALAFAIRESRKDARRAGTQPIPRELREKLINFYSSSLLDKVQFRVGQGHELSVQANAFRFGDASAVALIDTVIFANSWDARNNDELWAHELEHIEQYERWGVANFAKRYVRDYREVEAEADRAKARYARIGGQTLDQTAAHIENTGNREVNFSFRVKDGRWANYKIGAGKSGRYYCNGCLASFYEISLSTTGRGTLDYKLNPGREYVIFWNKDTRLWDVNSKR